MIHTLANIINIIALIITSLLHIPFVSSPFLIVNIGIINLWIHKNNQNQIDNKTCNKNANAKKQNNKSSYTFFNSTNHTLNKSNQAKSLMKFNTYIN